MTTKQKLRLVCQLLDYHGGEAGVSEMINSLHNLLRSGRVHIVDTQLSLLLGVFADMGKRRKSKEVSLESFVDRRQPRSSESDYYTA